MLKELLENWTPEKSYDPQKIKSIIDSNIDQIECAICGTSSDWHYTAETVYENGEYLIDLDGKEFVEIAGIRGSDWDSPVMVVYFNDGSSETYDVSK